VALLLVCAAQRLDETRLRWLQLRLSRRARQRVARRFGGIGR
jgi:hypothetical protein